MEFFTTEKVSPSTTKIVDITGVAVFLVEGRERAALIDTATGAGDLRSFVEGLTSKPLDVILTHGHCDHAGGAAGFERVWLHKADWELACSRGGMEHKMDYARYITGKELTAQDFAPDRAGDYLPLEPDQRFDLGGLTLEAVHLPGHTQGMTCVLNVEERTILFGDGCNPSVFLWEEESSSVEDYRAGLLRLKEQEHRWDTVWLSHGPTQIDKAILDGVIGVCDEIIAGTNDWQPFDFMGRPLRIAKRVENYVRADGGLGNIVYNPENIFASR